MRYATFLFALLWFPVVLWAAEPSTDAAALRVQLMETTKVIAVMGIKGPASAFKDDGDPDTLQVVFLSRKSDGPSRVTPDGEVIFLNHASEDLQSTLFGQAFDLRVARRLSGS